MKTTQSLTPPLASPARLGWLMLALAVCFVFAGTATIALERPADAGVWTHFAIWLACSLVGTLVLAHRLPRHDRLLFPIVILLCGWGLVAIERLAPAFADRQATWLCVSLLALLFTAAYPYALAWLRRYRYLLLALALLLLAATMILGSNPSGLAFAPRLWLGFGPIYFQPSEAMKFILVAFLASYLGEQSATVRANRSAAIGGSAVSPRLLGPILLMWLLSMVILVWQRDLGTAMLFFVVFILLLYVTSGDWRIIAGGALLVLAAGAAAYQLFDVVQLRVDIWLNPWPEADGRAYQIVQSLMAFAAGGIFGTGLGLGMYSQ